MGACRGDIANAPSRQLVRRCDLVAIGLVADIGPERHDAVGKHWSCSTIIGRVGLIPPAARGISSLQTCHHRQALDLVIQVGLQERIIVFERYTAIRIAIRPKHKAVSEQTGPAKDFLRVFRN